MRLLLTRAAEDAQATRAKLEAAGHTVLVSPVLEMVPMRAAWPAGVVDAVLATSAQAFAVTADWAQPTPEAKRLLPLYLVGERTLERAREAGFAGPVTVAPDAQGLSDALQKQNERLPRLVYLAGRDRKPAIEEAMAALSQPLEVIEVYAARRRDQFAPDALKALRNDAIDAVLHYSRRSAAIFADMAKGAELDISAVSHFAISEDAAQPLRRAECRSIGIASAPNEAALLKLLEDSPQEA